MCKMSRILQFRYCIYISEDVFKDNQYKALYVRVWNAIAVLCCLKALLHVTIYNILWFLYYIMRF